MSARKKLNKDFFKKWSPEMAYVLGFFAADGNMIRGSRGNHYISFYSTDKEIIEAIRKTIRSSHKVSSRRRGEKRKTEYRIQIGSKELFKDLMEIGMTPNKSNTLTFPTVSKSHFQHFVRGYFDGDGCVYFRKHMRKETGKYRWVFMTRFTSGNRHFLEELKKSLGEHVSGGFILQKNRGFELVFSHLDSLALYRLMYDNVSGSLFLRRKRSIFRKAVGTLYDII